MAIPNNQNQKKKKKGSGIWGLIFLAVVFAINRLDTDNLRRFFSRLRWELRTGRLDLNSRAAVAALAVVIGLVALIVIVSVVARSAKNKRFDGVRARRPSAAVSPMSGQNVQHSHDRLSGYRGDENAADHWKKQLDGFLEAGIIDRSEYKVLLERRRR